MLSRMNQSIQSLDRWYRLALLLLLHAIKLTLPSGPGLAIDDELSVFQCEPDPVLLVVGRGFDQPTLDPAFDSLLYVLFLSVVIKPCSHALYNGVRQGYISLQPNLAQQDQTGQIWHVSFGCGDLEMARYRAFRRVQFDVFNI